MAEPQQDRTIVLCKRCGGRIAVRNPERVPEEFSVACPHCGQRAFYQIRDIRSAEAR
jgi:DNA-directed RNA polymerase subunit RPC12/RpoP